MQLMMNGQGIFWVKVQLDPSIRQSVSPKVPQFWLELDPTCTIGTAVGKMKSSFGITQDLALFLEGYYLPTWMSAAMLVHAKEPLLAHPMRVDDNQFVTFSSTMNSSGIATQPGAFTPVKPTVIDITSASNPVGYTLQLVDGGISFNNNNNNGEAELDVKLEAVTPPEMSRIPATRKGRPPAGRGKKAVRKSKTPEGVEPGEPGSNETTPTTRRRYTRRTAKAIAAEENSAKRKAEEDPEASPTLPKKKPRDSPAMMPETQSVAETEPQRGFQVFTVGGSTVTVLHPQTSVATTFPKSAVASSNPVSDLDTLLYDVGSPEKDTTISPIEIKPPVELSEADIISLLEDSPPATKSAPTNTVTQANNSSSAVNGNSSSSATTSSSSSCSTASSSNFTCARLQDTKAGSWITFKETIQTSETDIPRLIDSVYYIESVNGFILNVVGPDYDLSTAELIQWKKKQLNYHSLSLLQLIDQQTALAKIYENWPQSPLFRAVQQ